MHVVVCVCVCVFFVVVCLPMEGLLVSGLAGYKAAGQAKAVQNENCGKTAGDPCHAADGHHGSPNQPAKAVPVAIAREQLFTN